MQRHRIDLFSLLAGLLFVAFAVVYIVGAYTSVHVNVRIALPLLLVWLGIAGLLGAVVAQRRSDEQLATAQSSEDGLTTEESQ